ncbi:YgaP family membrane protein [Pseudoalteromonas pernae]|uniref:YgaP family membrane protein n=1 Tax=Pseudoalteromonas pernae TaxID=3118054 RepID=UPI0032422F01
MKINAALRLIAGIMILLSLLLTYIGGPMWLWFTGFIALNLIQSAFSGWCPMISILRKLGMEE